MDIKQTDGQGWAVHFYLADLARQIGSFRNRVIEAMLDGHEPPDTPSDMALIRVRWPYAEPSRRKARVKPSR